MAQYLIANGPSPTTAAQVAVTTGTAIKTMQQVQTGATIPGRIKRWGISFNGSAAGVPIVCELLDTGTVAATVTAHVAAGIVKYDSLAVQNGDPTTALFQVGTANTGYTASAEGSITVTRMFDVQFIAPTNQYVFAFELGGEAYIIPGNINRVRVTAPIAVNAYTWMLVEV